MKKILRMLFNKKPDTGLRGKFNGDLYIDKDVFFKRKDFLEMLDKIKKAGVYPK